eukprot:CAMPEP_0117659004 /NCGR_PEP_ID=MMETSP0804-20121206/6187_1 /TAXON_ID=1074897 /ORGANISM="Tetraselmis astigmatica, Strain CCMP880" /LENGTH=192 /DNA_ID=CAMNT_0005465605 /DNA_START=63 /DNA_END=638 /DNA_ORIENTATION=+
MLTGTESTAGGGSSPQLPPDILATIVRHMSPSVRGVTRHASRRLNRIVKEVSMGEGGSPDNVRMKVTDMCASKQLLQWARSQGCPWYSGTAICVAAASHGSLEALQWARSHGCPWSRDVCATTARGAHMEVLRWAHASGCPWDQKTSAAAAAGGNLQVLQWLRDQGCPWDQWTCICAAQRGDLPMLQWARSK